MNNLQERLRKEGWIVGFTDGEGCFSVSIFRNKTTKFGWQLFPEFVVTQGESSLKSLQILENYFGCGKIYKNKRYDNHHEHLYRYCVRSVDDLHNIIIPFFKKHQLHTSKQKDFDVFVEIIELMHQKVHLTEHGLCHIARKIEKMNRKKASKFLASSEAICCAS